MTGYFIAALTGIVTMIVVIVAYELSKRIRRVAVANAVIIVLIVVAVSAGIFGLCQDDKVSDIPTARVFVWLVSYSVGALAGWLLRIQDRINRWLPERD